MGLRPVDCGVSRLPLNGGAPVTLAKNDVGFIDFAGTDHGALGLRLQKAICNSSTASA